MYDDRHNVDRDILCINQKQLFADMSCISKGLNPLETKLAVVSDTKRQGSIVIAVTEPLKEIGVKVGSRLFEIPHRNDIYIINPNMKFYSNCFSKIMKVLFKYVSSNDIQLHDTDELFIDITQFCKENKITSKAMSYKLIKEIENETQLSLSIGIGSNIFLSKMALNIDAVNQDTMIAEWRTKEIKSKLWPVNSLSKMWGNNERIQRDLNRLGIFTIGDLAKYPKQNLIELYGDIGIKLHSYSHGIDSNSINETHPIYQPLIHNKVQLGDGYQLHELKNIILENVEKLSMQLRSRDILAKTIMFSIEGVNQDTIEKKYTLKDGTNIAMDIFRVIWSFTEQMCDKQANYHTIYIALEQFVPEQARELNHFKHEFIKERNDIIENLKIEEGNDTRTNHFLKVSNL
ncbi:DNA repair protein [Mammaliicoccus sp. Dog046]|uniref:Y-family DNA polymerase n=1 Tax=Mammaliicoccus sp. Dog046 TaxID=3034233 RepID=UPI002B2572C7|nr:DNA repair protein [Mammaliicoccus sp. Dog046]WQK84428.1 DNA repair protein [Mammaliicoccus sp. Dog046]